MLAPPTLSVSKASILETVLLETFPQKLRRDYPDPWPVILMDLSGLKMSRWLSKEQYVGL